jgi:hypothetical protein
MLTMDSRLHTFRIHQMSSQSFMQKLPSTRCQRYQFAGQSSRNVDNPRRQEAVKGRSFIQNRLCTLDFNLILVGNLAIDSL